MTRRSLLIQCTDAHHGRLLDFTAPLHRAYAQRHGWDYWPLWANMMPKDRHPFWNKVALMMSALAFGCYDLAVWMDADCLITDPLTDLREAPLGEAMLGVTCPPDWTGRSDYILAGCYYVNLAHPLTEAFLKDAWASSHEWNDEWVFNRLRDHHPHYREAIQILDPKWHSHAEFHSTSGSVVVGYHNNGDPGTREVRLRNQAAACGLTL